MPCVLCADIGTSSLKAAVISEEGSVISWSRRSFAGSNPEFLAEEWLLAFKSACDEIFSDGTLKIDSICISGNGPTLAGSDGHTLLWNQKIPEDCLDSESAKKSLFIPRLSGFKKLYGDSWNDSEYIFSGPEFLIYRLTGSALTILPEERYTEAYWTEESLIQAGFDRDDLSKIPDFAEPSSLAGLLNSSGEEFLDHARNGIKQGLPVYCGAPDFIAALVGTGTLEAGLLCDRAGSSEGINLCTADPIYAPGVRTLPSIIPGLWNAGILIADSGSRFAEYKRRFEAVAGFEVGYSELVDAALMSDGSEAILDQGKYLMLQTAMEVRDGIKKLFSLAREKGLSVPTSFVLTGGQAGSDGFTQMKSSVTGLEIEVPECSDAELLGDAAFAFRGMGLYPGIKEAAAAMKRSSKIFAPGGDAG